MKQETQERLLAEYEVVVEWPGGAADNSFPPFTKGGQGDSSGDEQETKIQP